MLSIILNIFGFIFTFRTHLMRVPILFYLFLFSTLSFSQEYTAQWDGFYSYLNITNISENENNILASSENAIFKYNLNTHDVTKTSTINGLTGESISSYYYSNTHDTSIIGYKNGLIEIVTPDDVISVVAILNKQNIPPNKKQINHVTAYNGLIYFACDFGISTYDLDNLEFNETYYIGDNGAQIAVKQLAFNDEVIYAATEQGIKKASATSPNLIDYNVWETLNASERSGIVIIDDTIFTSKNNYLHKYNGTNFEIIQTLTYPVLDLKVSEEKIVLTSKNKVIVLNSIGETLLTVNRLDEYGSDFTTALIKDNLIYIGTGDDGILQFTLSDGTLLDQIRPSGPTENNAFSITANNNELWVTYGDHSISGNPYPITRKGYSYLKNDTWTNVPYSETLNAAELHYVSINPFNTNQVFMSSYFSGLLEINNGVATTLFNHENSGLESIGEYLNPPNPSYIDLRVGKSTFDADGKLWMSNVLTHSAVKCFDIQNNTWESFNFQTVLENENKIGDIEIDQNNNKWIASRQNGVLGLNENNGNPIVKKMSEETGNLPSRTINALAIDTDNNLWIGTTQGLRVLYNTSGFFNTANPQAESIIILDNDIPKELMFGQFITDIKVDGANNKWIATFDSGVFYLSSNGQETIYHFTKNNSPLPTNNITDIALDEVTGKVYFATVNGMVAFHNGPTKGADSLENIIVYPNPVRPNYKGTLKIKNLVDGSNLKITDISGNLVFETTVKGGTVYDWNMTAFGTHKIASGVYIIMVTAPDSEETAIEKVMIVR